MLVMPKVLPFPITLSMKTYNVKKLPVLFAFVPYLVSCHRLLKHIGTYQCEMLVKVHAS